MKTRSLDDIRRVVLHHTAHEPREGEPFAATIEATRRYHVETLGWGEIGYTALVRGGQVWPGRPIWLVGAHCRGHNADSVGIAVCGDLTQREPTRGEVEAVVSAIGAFEELLGRKLDILEHRALGKTLCPGPDLLKAVLDRREVLA